MKQCLAVLHMCVSCVLHVSFHVYCMVHGLWMYCAFSHLCCLFVYVMSVLCVSEGDLHDNQFL